MPNSNPISGQSTDSNSPLLQLLTLNMLNPASSNQLVASGLQSNLAAAAAAAVNNNDGASSGLTYPLLDALLMQYHLDQLQEALASRILKSLTASLPQLAASALPVPSTQQPSILQQAAMLQQQQPSMMQQQQQQPSLSQQPAASTQLASLLAQQLSAMTLQQSTSQPVLNIEPSLSTQNQAQLLQLIQPSDPRVGQHPQSQANQQPPPPQPQATKQPPPLQPQTNQLQSHPTLDIQPQNTHFNADQLSTQPPPVSYQRSSSDRSTSSSSSSSTATDGSSSLPTEILSSGSPSPIVSSNFDQRPSNDNRSQNMEQQRQHLNDDANQWQHPNNGDANQWQSKNPQRPSADANQWQSDLQKRPHTFDEANNWQSSKHQQHHPSNDANQWQSNPQTPHSQQQQQHNVSAFSRSKPAAPLPSSTPDPSPWSSRRPPRSFGRGQSITARSPVDAASDSPRTPAGWASSNDALRVGHNVGTGQYGQFCNNW